MFPIPQQFFAPWLFSNLVALTLLLLAFRKPSFTRWGLVVIFALAAMANAWHATVHPAVYVEYADLAIVPIYERFISGWFSEHVRLVVYPIACGQLAIAFLLTQGARWRRIGAFGASIFLLAIAPLGVGAAFPFSFLAVGALFMMERAIEESAWHHAWHIRTFTT